jgi:hypothetical protein
MFPDLLIPLAQAEHLSEQHQYETLAWGGGLIAVLLVGGVAIRLLRRHVHTPSGPPEGCGFTLAELKDMRARGDLTEPEYQAARRRVIAQVQAADLAAQRQRQRNPGAQDAE